MFRTHHRFPFKADGSGGAEGLSWHDALPSVVVVHHQCRLVEVVGFLHAPHLLLHLFQRVELAAQQGNPRGRAMTVSIGVTAEEILHLLQIEVSGKVPPLHPRVGGHAIQRKHVDVDAAQILQVHPFDERGAGILNLGKRERIRLVRLITDHLERGGHPFLGMRHQQVVVPARHADVEVVVPWDEPLVAHGSQQGACNDVIAQSMLAAHLMDAYKDAQDAQLQWPYVVGCHERVC